MGSSRLQRRTAAALALAAGAASAQGIGDSRNIIKLGVSRYTTHSRTDGITGIGVPAGADAKTGDATTVVLIYERALTPNIGAELVLGVPPRVKARATGTVAYLGDDILSAKNVAPTAYLTYRFNDPGATWRPYVAAGVNYTRFTGVESRLASDVKLGDSFGWALAAGVDYSLSRQWGLFASVAALRVKSKLVASGATVLQTTIDLRPVTYTAGVFYKF